MKRLIEWTPAFDKRDPDPTKNYGIGSMAVRFVLTGTQGAVQFLLYTGWYLKRNRDEHRHTPGFGGPVAADLGYHSYKPHYKDETPVTESCPYLNGAPCYYDGSGLAAERVFDVFITEGEDALWNELEDYYRDTFGEDLDGVS